MSHFFNRLGKILTYAFIGTFITTLFIGFSLYGISQAGFLSQVEFTLSESLAFAALISAIDPVATLCTFGCLRVEPTLSITIMGGEAERGAKDGWSEATAKATYRLPTQLTISPTLAFRSRPSS